MNHEHDVELRPRLRCRLNPKPISVISSCLPLRHLRPIRVRWNGADVRAALGVRVRGASRHEDAAAAGKRPPLLPSPAMKIGRNLVDARRQQGMLLL
jgi:hypothetical protein